jgi:hypothetical protein
LKRRLFALAAAVSLLLCAATVALLMDGWVSGSTRTLFRRAIYTGGGGIDGSVELRSWRGGLLVQIGQHPAFAGIGTRFQWLVA